MAFRALSFPSGTSSIPVTSSTYQVARNPIVEDAISAVGEAMHYGGIYVTTGSVEAPYRSTLEPMIVNLFGGAIASGVVELPAAPWSTLAMADEYGNGFSFPSVYVNSMTFTFNVKEYAKVSFNWIGTKAYASATAIATAPVYTDPIALFYNAQLSVNGSVTNATAITIQVERPIDQDYYVLGSEFLQNLAQSGPVTVTGSITLAPKDWANFKTAIAANTDGLIPSTGNTNAFAPFEIIVTLRKPDGTAFKTITIDAAVIDTQSFEMQGRQKINKVINWRARITSTENIKITAS